jgi:DtxR family Mn-dependent transcriptional regulator
MLFGLAAGLGAVGIATIVLVRLGRARRERRLREDLLKRFHQCERQQREVQIEALAGMLEVPVRRVHAALQRLFADDLVRSEDRRLRLTARGREAARALVRRHRLLETYLAEHEGVPLATLHRRADRLEHRLSRERVDAIDRSLGHPLHDPHGDPIPNGVQRTGRPTVPLDLCPPGTVVSVAHVEDEPDAFSRELVDHGIVPGAALEVVDNDERGVTVAVAGRGEARLSAPVATQVDVVPSHQDVEEVRAILNLDDLPMGEAGRVVMLTSDLRGEGRRRLLDLGFTPGAVVRPVLENALGDDPTAYLVRQSKIALRREQARHVLVAPEAAADPVPAADAARSVA